MKKTFKRPTEELRKKNRFSHTEVGLSHQFTPAHVRLCDNGDVEIWAAAGLGIVFHVANKSCTIMADNVKFLTKDQDGLRWNNLSFNFEATEYEEPAFTPYDTTKISSVYNDLDEFFEDD